MNINTLENPVNNQSGVVVKRSLVKESKVAYKKESKLSNMRRGTVTYFDRDEIDPRLEAEFFEMIDLSHKGEKNTVSLAQVYDIIVRSSNKVKLIPKYDQLRLYKQMYLVMLRYTSFICFTYIIIRMYPNRLVEALLNKVLRICSVEDLNIENLFVTSNNFPTQSQTLDLIDQESRQAISKIKQYTEEIVSYLLSRNVKGLIVTIKEPVLKVQILSLFIKDYSAFKGRPRDKDYLVSLLAKYIRYPKSLQSNFNDVMYKQLESYINDLYLQLAQIIIPSRMLTEIIQTEFPSEARDKIIPMLKVFDDSSNIRTTPITELISLKPDFFLENQMISLSEFKNLLQAIELTIRDINLNFVKNIGPEMTRITDSMLEYRQSKQEISLS